MDEEFVVGFMNDAPDGLTPIDIVMDITGLTYQEVKSSCEILVIHNCYGECNFSICERQPSMCKKNFYEKNSRR